MDPERVAVFTVINMPAATLGTATASLHPFAVNAEHAARRLLQARPPSLPARGCSRRTPCRDSIACNTMMMGCCSNAGLHAAALDHVEHSMVSGHHGHRWRRPPPCCPLGPRPSCQSHLLMTAPARWRSCLTRCRNATTFSYNVMIRSYAWNRRAARHGAAAV
jgi:hypothetical protein